MIEATDSRTLFRFGGSAASHRKQASPFIATAAVGPTLADDPAHLAVCPANPVLHVQFAARFQSRVRFRLQASAVFRMDQLKERLPRAISLVRRDSKDSRVFFRP